TRLRFHPCLSVSIRGPKRLLMLDLLTTRRGFLRVGSASLIGLSLSEYFRLKAEPAKAKSVIQLWMAGGPTQTDTWDPKPQAGEDFTGPLRGQIATNVSGIQVSTL